MLKPAGSGSTIISPSYSGLTIRLPHVIKSLAHRLAGIEYQSEFNGGAGISRAFKTVSVIEIQSVSP